jgi:hypothetical protein
MTARAGAPLAVPPWTRLLAIALVVVTLLPIAVFATDLTNRHIVTSLRDRTRQEANAQRATLPPDIRREQLRARRARQQPSAARFAMSIALQFAMLLVIAVVGRRLFALRL